ncbi:MAG: hypothetical protein FWH31_01735 [Streptococcaceae bacterium]|nr:hypothetical protein [Streptococcaceae bacterium]
MITSSVGDSFSPTDVSRTKAKFSAAYPPPEEVGDLARTCLVESLDFQAFLHLIC